MTSQGSKQLFICGSVKFGKSSSDNHEASQLYRKMYENMVSEEKFCVIKPYQLSESKNISKKVSDQISS